MVKIVVLCTPSSLEVFVEDARQHRTRLPGICFPSLHTTYMWFMGLRPGLLPFLNAPSISHPGCINKALHIRILVYINRKNDRNIYFLSVSSAQSQSNCLQPFIYFFLFPHLLSPRWRRSEPSRSNDNKKNEATHTQYVVYGTAGRRQLNYRVVT